MANKTVSYGSSGEDVRKLQEALNKAGYKLDVDGQFGPKTQSAVKSYQQKNGLAVDGIVGVNTWNSLNKQNTSTNKTQNSSSKSKTQIKEPTSKKRPTYEKNESVVSAENKLAEWESSKPSDYESRYSEEIESILNSILNREKFSYNMNADPLYNQYKEQYISNGKKAMLNTIANASALSGGYSNSYAVTAGNEAYNENLSKLNNIAIDLYDRAYSRYKNEGDSLVDKITVLRGLDGDDYNKYRDELSNYYKDGDYLLNKLTSLSDADYKAFLAEVDAFESDRDYEYEKYVKALEQQNFDTQMKFEQEKFEKEMAFKKSEAERDQRNADRSYSLSASKASSTSKSKEKKQVGLKTTLAPTTYEQYVYLTGFPDVFNEFEFALRDNMKKKYGTYENYLQTMYMKYLKKQEEEE